MNHVIVTKEDERTAGRAVPAWLAAHRRYKKMKWYNRISRKKLMLYGVGVGFAAAVVLLLATRDMSWIRQYLGVANMFIP